MEPLRTTKSFKGISDITIFENEDFVILNKPAGVLSIPDRTQSEPSLKDMLIEKYGSILTVHRLDRETSGIILFAKNETAHKYFSKQFEERGVEKFYMGLVHGTPIHKTGTIDAAIMENPVFKGQMVINKKGKPSVTDYEVIEELGKYSLVKFQIHTGRTHQIRVHAKNIGHPIVCDPLYGDGKPVLLSSFKKKFKLSKHDEEERPILNRVALHSYQLKFKDAAGKPFDLTAELPKDIRALMQQLKKIH
ncbi:RNA pseudouridine synthase [Ferruginibacter lapsinanis]|uniref:RluA family pseudouridine synthase n=1 Tax=Ferruginibacter lapsinanis TaxID=563172 RepID=UPI001E330BC8|nr:RNA pseudouridine synthase [Ferruginibacter lapsinanis]UEG50030.1 RNA pseudouridine synthase [Ferruginibacter lapsinanis]